jgi:hypothetical protein
MVNLSNSYYLINTSQLVINLIHNLLLNINQVKLKNIIKINHLTNLTANNNPHNNLKNLINLTKNLSIFISIKSPISHCKTSISNKSITFIKVGNITHKVTTPIASAKNKTLTKED